MEKESTGEHEIGVYKKQGDYHELFRWDETVGTEGKNGQLVPKKTRVKKSQKKRGRKKGQKYTGDLPEGLRGVSRRLGMDQLTIDATAPQMPGDKRWRLAAEGYFAYIGADLPVLRVEVEVPARPKVKTKPLLEPEVKEAMKKAKENLRAMGGKSVSQKQIINKALKMYFGIKVTSGYSL
jgi:hypothetical protein